MIRSCTRCRVLVAALLALLTMTLPVRAQPSDGHLDIGGDRFAAGGSVTVAEGAVDDLFVAGARVRVDLDVTGSAHLAGRIVEARGAVAGDLYAAGMDVSAPGAVAGDATLAGYEVTAGSVGGNLRASGTEVTVADDVAGYALLTADELRIDGQIGGDVRITANRLDFGPGARIDGTVTLFEETPGALDVPAEVAGADRVVRRAAAEWEREVENALPSRTGLLRQFLTGVITVTALAALLAAVLPQALAGLRGTILDHPLRSAWIGVLSISALLGGAVLSALTLIGLLATPALLLGAGLLGFGGYVIGVYALGVAILRRFGRAVPDDFGDRAMAAAVGALAAGLIALIPFLGWLVVMALALAGAGAMVIAWINPRFFGRV